MIRWLFALIDDIAWQLAACPLWDDTDDEAVTA